MKTKYIDDVKPGKTFNETIDNLKQYWWEKERRPEIEQAVEKAHIDDETRLLIKSILSSIRIKKMEDYLKDG